MFRTLLGAALGVAAALPGTGAGAQSARPQAVRAAPDTWMVQGRSALGSAANRNFISNAAFVVTRDGVVVVDALGSPALAQELLAEIRRITPAPVRNVIVTHSHADHVYGLQALKAAEATVVALRPAAAVRRREPHQRLKHLPADGAGRQVRRLDRRHPITTRAGSALVPMAALSTSNMIPLTVAADRRSRLEPAIPGEWFEDDVLGFAQWP